MSSSHSSNGDTAINAHTDAEADAQKPAALETELQLERSANLRVLVDPIKGRGIYASTSIPINTLVVISPVLLVSAEEYRRHALYGTVFESYLFTWSRATGDMALALGLGSLFNHSAEQPNVSFSLDKERQTIRYTTKREVKEGEELCIYYGHGIVFGEKGELLVKTEPTTPENEEEVFKVAGLLTEEEEDALNGDTTEANNAKTASTHEMDEHALINLDSLPVQHITNILSPEDIPLETMDIYALRIHSRDLGPIFAFLKDANLDSQLSLKHCRRVKRSPERPEEAIVSLCPVDHMPLSELIAQMQVSTHLAKLDAGEVMTPEIMPIPANPARTPAQAKEWKKEIWPVSLIPIREDVLARQMKESWSVGKLEWMRQMCEMTISLAQTAESEKGEHSIACVVTEGWDGSRHSLQEGREQPIILASAHDTRLSSSNPLQHCVLNLLRQVAALDLSSTRPTIPNSSYLLTNLTVFMTHEPCLLCSMALLHSRIGALVYVRQSKGAGGCGSEYWLHEQKGTNHRFEVCKVKEGGEWRCMRERVKMVELDP